MSDDGSIEHQEPNLSVPEVVTKYKAAADICNRALLAVIEAAKDGAKVVDLCRLGDQFINKECANIYKGKEIEKGVAFPTCVSANSIVGHFSPNSEDATALKNGDVVKIDMGCHIDGFIATQATTIVVGDAAISGKAADVIAAARTAFDAAVRLIRPGKHIADVSAPLQKVAESFGCNLVEGVMSHEMKQFVIDGSKCILNKPTPDQKVEDAEFEENEVYAVDIVVSSGEGKPRVLDEKETTVYKRALEVAYQLKMQASRAVFSLVNSAFATMPFTLRALLDEAAAQKTELKASQLKLGLVECLNHGLLHPYPVLHEKPGEVVAQIKGTVLLMPNGSSIITSAPRQPVTTEKKVEDKEILDLLATPISAKSAKKKKNKDKAAEPAAAK
ncbi:hypothetical protein HYH02_013050 [Chlamydomonas schloesseri]|uniref:Peptidase M24 domain-containing protein n=1 Tax=Chlamydomonas schloesseri TaxID=2026947 RepID=A0A835T4I7_9CHLO|nr:hypothetical protein HYH02_013050 [Chlamydomonas schloesseri]|eukprot:KAG2432330.1 hypothetical protein HYH02_013050 [Chlamydomonas schloesseri]